MQPVKLSEFGVPGAELPGILYLRNVADADALVAAIKATKEAGGKVGACSGMHVCPPNSLHACSDEIAIDRGLVLHCAVSLQRIPVR